MKKPQPQQIERNNIDRETFVAIKKGMEILK